MKYATVDRGAEMIGDMASGHGLTTDDLGSLFKVNVGCHDGHAVVVRRALDEGHSPEDMVQAMAEEINRRRAASRRDRPTISA